MNRSALRLATTLRATSCVLALLAVRGVATSAAQSQNLVVNGDFESPAIATNFVSHPTGGSVGGWVVDRGSVDVARTCWEAATGSQSVDLNGLTAGGIHQDLSTTPGTTYLLRFALAGNPLAGPSLKRVEVGWGSTTSVVTFDTAGRSSADMGWSYQQLSVRADATTTRVRFVSLTTGDAGPAIDDVSVTAATTVPTTPTPTRPPSGGVLGGRDFGIATTRVDPAGNALASPGVLASWTAGSLENDYAVLRMSGAGVATLRPTGSTEGPTGTTYVVFDGQRLAGPTCYVLVLLLNGAGLGNSDLLCLLSFTESPTGAPQGFGIRLNQTNTAVMTWSPPHGASQDSYLLVPLGGTPRPLPGAATNVGDTMTSATCYMVVAMRGATPLGNTDILCGLPGFARSN